MELSSYFENTEGLGVLATADADGHVDVALYGRPHVLEDGTVALIMRPRLSYRNLTTNPNAAYLFLENDEGYKGIRLYLTKLREESDAALIAKLRRRPHGSGPDDPTAKAHLVIFQIDHTRPLTGDAT